jgi:hypothetical protein
MSVTLKELAELSSRPIVNSDPPAYRPNKGYFELSPLVAAMNGDRGASMINPAIHELAALLAQPLPRAPWFSMKTKLWQRRCTCIILARLGDFADAARFIDAVDKIADEDEWHTFGGGVSAKPSTARMKASLCSPCSAEMESNTGCTPGAVSKLCDSRIICGNQWVRNWRTDVVNAPCGCK